MVRVAACMTDRSRRRAPSIDRPTPSQTLSAAERVLDTALASRCWLSERLLRLESTDRRQTRHRLVEASAKPSPATFG